MRDYGKVHSSFWTSPTILGLTDDGKMLALYLMTSPHSTIAGVFRLPDGYVCEDMGWTSGRVAKGFAELLEKGFANRCETSKWVWIRKHFIWNPPENPNQRKAAKKLALQIPDECLWKQAFMQEFGAFLDISEDQFGNPSETVSEQLAKAFANQEQDQEQDSKSASPRGSRLPHEELPKDWREWALSERPDLDPDSVFARFADYWRAQPGAKGRKSDWLATWRNWVRDQRSTPRVVASNSEKPWAGAI